MGGEMARVPVIDVISSHSLNVILSFFVENLIENIELLVILWKCFKSCRFKPGLCYFSENP